MIIICLHTNKWLQVFLCIPNNSVIISMLNEKSSSISKKFNLAYVMSANQFKCESSIWSMAWSLSGTTQAQSRLESDGNEGVLCIPQSSSITGASPSDCLVSYPSLTPLHRCIRCIPQPQSTGQYIYIYIYIYMSVDDNIYDPPWGLSTLAKELSVAASVMQKLFVRIEHSGSR